MDILGYIKDHQPVLYRTFQYALTRNKVSHAYLLAGEEGMPLLEMASFIAKSIVCAKPTPFADQTCWHCLRFDQGNYADFHLLNGRGETIKKEDILSLESALSLTPLEDAGKHVYVINAVENITQEAIQSLLKFLEEPTSEIYAILTTENVERVLPTIVSRTQVIPIKNTDQNLVITAALKKMVNVEDAELLSFFHVDAERIVTQAQDEVYLAIKEMVVTILQAATVDREKAKFLFRFKAMEQLSQREEVKLFLDLLMRFLKESLHHRLTGSTLLNSYAKLISTLSQKFPHLEKALLMVMERRSQIDLNVQPGLMLEDLAQTLFMEG